MKKKKECSCSLKKNMWVYLSVILFASLIVSLVFLFSASNRECDYIENIDDTYLENASKIGEETKEFLELVFEIEDMQLSNSVYENNMYTHTFRISDQDFDILTSLNGEIVFVPGLGEPLNKSEVLSSLNNENNQQVEQELEKSQRPVVELFVMSHCPYGIQIEKGILPVLDVLEDHIDFELKFVNYSMRGEVEVTEQTIQYCIQKESKTLLKDYLYCFLEDGDGERCLLENNISLDDLDGCISEADEEYQITALLEDRSSWLNDRFPKFLINDEDNLKYEVRGSPTLVINGVVVGSQRDPQSLLDTICGAFETIPRACNQELSRTNPSPQFGFETTGSSTVATCG